MGGSSVGEMGVTPAPLPQECRLRCQLSENSLFLIESRENLRRRPETRSHQTARPTSLPLVPTCGTPDADARQPSIVLSNAAILIVAKLE